MKRTTASGSAEHIHLIGIGGTGMTALAGLLSRTGCRVTGSDGQLYPPTSSILEALACAAVLEAARVVVQSNDLQLRSHSHDRKRKRQTSLANVMLLLEPRKNTYTKS